MLNLYVIRHGQTDANIKGVFQGRRDIKLNKTGRKQALELARKFENIKIDYILSSPLSRAKQTAEIISKSKKVPIEIENDLKERSFGDMEGKFPTDNFNINLLVDFDLNYDGHNIETIKKFYTRVYKKMEEIKKKYINKDIIIVTHAGVAQAIISYFEKNTINVLEYTLENAEIRKIHLD